MEELLLWIIRKYGEAVLTWSVQQLFDRMTQDGADPEIHGGSCECHSCGTVFDDDELGIDPEAEYL